MDPQTRHPRASTPRTGTRCLTRITLTLKRQLAERNKQMTEPSHEEATRLVAEILGQYMADWSPEDIREALSDLESVTVYVPPRPERNESLMPITILDYVKFQIGEKDSYSAENFHSAGVDIMGGCEGCAATIAGYNAYPSQSGYWRCADCIGNTGFATAEDFMNFEPRPDNDY